MNEKPLEWISVYGESMGHKVGRICALAAAVVVFVFSFLTLQLVMFIVAVAFGVLFAWLQMHAFTEYEFCYFSDEIDVAAIYNRARRKKKMSFRMENIEYMVKKVEPQQVTRYYGDKNNMGSIYTLVVNQDGKRTAIVMESDPEFTKVMEMKRKLR